MRDLLWKIVDNRWTLAAFIVGTALGLLGLSSPLWSASPEISAGPPAGELFKQSFRIKNPSQFFGITNFVLRCAPNVSTKSHAGISDISFTMFKTGHLAPGETGTYTCLIPLRFMEDDPIVTGSMIVSAEYDSALPLWPRVRTEVVFTLDPNAAPPQWVQGKRLQ
ncbi:hypothetical protein [Bradyrhizobium yuanmingense]|uniref:hypothetical protein n=1 Tax=Bradyrhizobium yuanmingense TaxID=108015 RepID=UPI0011A0604C|nr:hypothetical protein [Bradyrhizobium yuanmingense]